MAEDWKKKLKKQLMGNDIGIDLGTTSVLVFQKEHGVILNEPCIALVDKQTDRIVKVGLDALKMPSGASEGYELVRPLRDGVIQKYGVALQMVDHYIRRACGSPMIKPRVIVCVPSGVTEVEEYAVMDAAAKAGARQIFLMEEAVAAAIGAGLNIDEPRGKMIVDIGGGTTDVAVLSLGQVVASESVPIAGDEFDEAIMRYMRNQYGMLIGSTTAEKIKRTVGSVYGDAESSMEVKGRDMASGLPKTCNVCSREMLEALAEPVTAIIDAICLVIARTPPELTGDILEEGIVLAGGGSLLRGIDKLIGKVTGIATRVAESPIECVVKGTGYQLDHLNEMKDGPLNLSKEREKRL